MEKPDSIFSMSQFRNRLQTNDQVYSFIFGVGL